MRALIVLSVIATALAASAGHAGTTADVRRGHAIFQARCSLCHDDSEHMLNDVGPALFGVVNRPVGSVPGYGYSPALTAAHARGERWTVKKLKRLLVEPTHVYSGTSMPAAIDDADDRKAMVAYLMTLRPRD